MAAEMIAPKVLAKRMGLDGRTVAAHLKTAGLRPDVEGLVPLDRATAIIEAAADTRSSAGHGAMGRGHHNGSDVSEIGALAKSRADAEAMRARKLRLEIETKEGKLLDKATVMAAFADLVTRTRDHLLLLPAQIASRVSGITDERKIAAIIDDEIRRALTTLSDAEAFNREILA